jgi:hypothetical protein
MSDHHDDWFHDDHGVPGMMHSHGDFNAYAVIGFLSVLIVGTGLIIAIFIGWFGREIWSLQAAVQEGRTPLTEFTDAQAVWNEHLRGEPKSINVDEQRIRIPLDIAIEEVVKDYR